MSQTKHTPGPWVVNETNGAVESKTDHGWANDGWIVCETFGPEGDANANLIAAAPELLDSLKETTKKLGALLFDGSDAPVIRKALEVVAKAEGRS